jgi:hypothetical protein
LKKVEEYLRNAAELRELAVGALSAHRQRLGEMAETWERLAELEKRDPAAEDDNVIEFVLPENDNLFKFALPEKNDPKRKPYK